MSSAGYFERLAASVERIARHAYYPGIDQTISQCLEDIDELRTVGRITAEECEALRFVLLGVAISTSAKPAASNAASAACQVGTAAPVPSRLAASPPAATGAVASMTIHRSL